MWTPASASPPAPMIQLTGKDEPGVIAALAEHVDRPFRARQIARWILHRGAQSFNEMTDLPRSLRESLGRTFVLDDPEIVQVVSSADGSNKYLFRLADGATIESVAIPDRDKMTLCLSSQTGCAVGCTFCVTGALGPGRNLLPHEIVGQYRVIARQEAHDQGPVNIVFMGMGEPLLNIDNLGPSLDALFETISPKRITVSTSGIIPGIRWLAGLPRRPKFAVSLNAPDQALREKLMPITRRYPIDQLMAEVRRFPLERGRRITFEYVLIRGVNDSEKQARTLVRLVHGVPSKVNLIPLNSDPIFLPGLERPSDDVIDRFARVLRDAGRTVTVRWSKGHDVAAACGQLKGLRYPMR